MNRGVRSWFATVWVVVSLVQPLGGVESPRTTGSPFLHAWRSEDYGASPVNWRIEQHPTTGYIYVANNLGVLEFDGANWRLIPLPHGGAARTLVIDPAGTIWVGGAGELAKLVPTVTGELQAVDQTARVLAALGPNLRAAPTTEMGESESAGGTTAGASNALDTIFRAIATPQGVVFRVPDALALFAPDGTLRVVPAKLRVGQLWWMDGATYLEEITRGARRLDVDRLLPPEGDAWLSAFAAQPDPGGGWRLLSARGPVRWTGATESVVALDPDAADLFRDERPTCAVFLADGRSVYGMTRSGLVVFDRDGKYDRRVDRRQGLPGNRVNGIGVDLEGGVWLAMPTGVVRVQLDSPFAVHGEAQGLTGGPRQLARAGDRLYVAHGEGFAWRSDQDGQFRPVAGFRTGTHQVVAGDDGVLVTAQGLHEVAVDGTNRALAGSFLYGLAPLRRFPGRLLASSAAALRFYGRDVSGGWRQDGELKNLPAGVDDILERDNGFVWVATRTGEIWRIDLTAGLTEAAPARRYGPDRGVPTALRSDKLKIFTLGADLLAASARWLLRYDASADRFVPEMRFPALDFAGGRGPDNTAPAADGGAWFFRRQPSPHFTRLRPDGAGGWRVERLAASPLAGLVLNSLFHDAVQDTLWIAGQGTLVSLDLRWHSSQAAPPLRAVVRRVLAPDGRIVAAPDARPGALVFPPSENSLRFEFAAPTFVSEFRGATSLQYRSRVAGLDRDWTPWSHESRRDVSNLPPGDFSFLVEARDLNGRSGAAIPVEFAVAAPWWRTPWAYAAAGLFAALGVVGVVKLRTRVLRRHNARLEELVADRTAELERLAQIDRDESAAARLAAERARLETLRYQLNPHFLYNSLGSIRSLVHSRPAAADEMTTRLVDFFRLTLTRDEGAIGTLRDEFDLIANYLEMERIRWRERLQTRIDAEPATLAVQVPPFLLLPLVENAIKYGARTSEEVVQVNLTARFEDADTLVIEVANTGRWIDASEPGSAASTGIGRENLRQRLARYYPHRHGFNTAEAEGWVRVSLRLGAGGPAIENPKAII